MAATAKIYDYDLGFRRSYDENEYPNDTNLKADKERAVLARLQAELVLPEDTILKVDMDFDVNSGYNGNAVIVMDDLGAELIADAFTFKYGEQAGKAVLEKWQNRDQPEDPRLPTFLFVQKPEKAGDMPVIFAGCGTRDHTPPRKAK
ncbi:hypothetical protein HR060_16240 [Catenovulum sp. SM1970]|uniref:hypothetical protein n=1 Tax=Marinifaba aquimaris TaxID=2741323 RepID=UPI0015735B49|nr:hypothetical protein [Marinifaba aquimaris]NTS78399.1 hypothetical protein [Marinifaba aquimaris]